MSGFYLSAAHKSSGKTMLSIGLAAAFRERQLSVQCFKKGPDYIDPIWLSLASGNPCQTLDFYTSSKDFISAQFQQYSDDNQIVLVEGNKGLYDGISVDGSDSNAAMAKQLKLPVVLVIDTAGITRGIAPLLQGYVNFDHEVDIAGVILNKTGGSRHTAKLINAVETYTDLPVFGAIPRDPSLALCERHLGLVPGNEIGDQAGILIEKWRQVIEKEIDLEALLKLGPTCHEPQADIQSFQPNHHSGLRIAIAKDKAFGFYYPADLERFKSLGIDLVNFDTSSDRLLPENIDGLFIGGGFPETNLQAISSNTSLLIDIKSKIESGLPTYAECGGLMYLCRRISYKGQSADVAGVIPADIMMHDKPKGRGYVRLGVGENHPWGAQPEFSDIHAHEFHYSTLINCEALKFAYRVNRGQGIDGNNDGIICHNLLASYSHLRHTDSCPWVDQFINFVRLCKSDSRYDYSQQKRSRTN